MKTEYRVAQRALECRAAGEARQFAGYAALFDTETTIGDYFVESIAPGAFTAALRSNGDVVALFNHDSGQVLGRRSAGTLRLSEDAKGLAVEIDPPETTLGRDLAESIRRGDIGGMSFGFRVTDERWTDPPEDAALPRRQILGLELIEVSVVTFPAYDETTIGLRSLDAAREALAARARPDSAPDFHASTLRRRLQLAEVSLKLSACTAA